MRAKQTSLWVRLQAEVKRLTAGYGERAAVARELGVSRQVFNGWLSGASAPGAEHTLRLLQWVEQREAQNKTPGSATNTARGKQTRSRISRETKPKSGPP